MSEHDPDIYKRDNYEKLRDDEIFSLRELLLDFAELWPDRISMHPDKIITVASADYDEEEAWTAVGEPVKVRHSLHVVSEDFNDSAEHERFEATVSTQVLNRLPQFNELDGQLFAVTDRLPEPLKQRYILTFSKDKISAKVSSMDMRLNRTTVHTMTKYDLQQLTKALDDYMEVDDEASTYADNE